MSENKIFVEPTTVVAVAKIAYAAWQSYQKNRREQEQLDLLRSIDRRLDRVLDNQHIMLKKLAELKVFISAEIRANGIEELLDRVDAHRSNYEVMRSLASINKEEALARAKLLELPTRTLCFELLEKGFSVLIMSVPSAILHLAVLDMMRRLGEPEDVIKELELSFLKQWERIFDSWMEADEVRGIPHAAKALQENRERWESECDKFPRHHKLGWKRTRKTKQEGRNYYRQYRRLALNITGSKESGFGDKVVWGSDKEWRLYHREEPIGPHHKLIDDDGMELSGRLEAGVLEKALLVEGLTEEELALGTPAIISRILGEKAMEKALLATHKITKQLQGHRKRWIKAVTDEADFAEFVAVALKIRVGVAERQAELSET